MSQQNEKLRKYYNNQIENKRPPPIRLVKAAIRNGFYFDKIHHRFITMEEMRELIYGA